MFIKYQLMIKRDFYLDKLRQYRNTDEIKVICGIRRCGKTVLLKQLMDELIQDGIASDNIIFISFESSRYRHIKNDIELDKVILEKTKDIDGKIYLLFDEIQQVSNWEKSINSYRVDFDCDIYITGSNSKLLSGELVTLLSGRYITLDIFPFSFKELLEYYDGIDEKILFNQYLNYGGFPSLLNYGNDGKVSLLQDLYSTIILNDILYRSNIKDFDLLKRLMEFMICNVGQTFSATSISNFIKNERKTTPATIINFLEYIMNAFVLYQVKREDIKLKKKLLISEKYYVADPGFYYLFKDESQRDWGQLLENVVFIELIRRGYSVNVGKVNDLEIDFVCYKANKKKYIQVSESVKDFQTREREFKPLCKLKDNYPKYLITNDDENYSNEGIVHLNILDFLKSDEDF